MCTYQRVETIRHPSSLDERPSKSETLNCPADVDFDCLDDAHWVKDNRVIVRRAEDGTPDFVEMLFPWWHDFTQTIIVRYTRLAREDSTA